MKKKSRTECTCGPALQAIGEHVESCATNKKLVAVLTSGEIRTDRVGMVLSRSMSFSNRAAFVRFAKSATIGHWAEVIAFMENELRRQGHNAETGDEDAR